VEVWNPIPEFDGYEASTNGSIRKNSGKVLCKSVTQRGYHCVTIYKNGWDSRRAYLVHHLVLFAHVGPKPSPTCQCRHLNGIKFDNRLENLRWGTVAENVADKINHGTLPVGEDTHFAKLTEEDVREILLSTASAKALAKLYGVKRDAIFRIRRRDTWKHLTYPQ